MKKNVNNALFDYFVEYYKKRATWWAAYVHFVYINGTSALLYFDDDWEYCGSFPTELDAMESMSKEIRSIPQETSKKTKEELEHEQELMRRFEQTYSWDRFLLGIPDELCELKLGDITAFGEITKGCVSMRELYRNCAKIMGLKDRNVWSAEYVAALHEQTDLRADTMYRLIWEHIGYWELYLKNRVSRRKSALTKKVTKKKNVREIEKILAKNNFEVSRNVLVEGQMITDRGERTVKNIIKEIIESKKTGKNNGFT